MGRNLSSWLKEKFPAEIYNLLKLSGEVAEENGFHAYLVGGSVRDLLRGEENLDIDIVIEGMELPLQGRSGKDCSAKVRTHQKFNTAQIFPDHSSLMWPQHRTEYYESPAALPKVETSSIKKDLYRRDFTINTLAVKLNPQDFGLLIDFFGGQSDLQRKNNQGPSQSQFRRRPDTGIQGSQIFREVRIQDQ